MRNASGRRPHERPTRRPPLMGGAPGRGRAAVYPPCLLTAHRACPPERWRTGWPSLSAGAVAFRPTWRSWPDSALGRTPVRYPSATPSSGEGLFRRRLLRLGLKHTCAPSGADRRAFVWRWSPAHRGQTGVCPSPTPTVRRSFDSRRLWPNRARSGASGVRPESAQALDANCTPMLRLQALVAESCPLWGLARGRCTRRQLYVSASTPGALAESCPHGAFAAEAVHRASARAGPEPRLSLEPSSLGRASRHCVCWAGAPWVPPLCGPRRASARPTS